MIKGSCLCGGVQFEFEEQSILLMNNCHCSKCRKVSGADYGTFIQVPFDQFRWVAGEELVSTFESSPGNHRAFCNVCGSRAPQINKMFHVMTIPGGALDGDPKTTPEVSIFTADKAPWHKIDESILSFPDAGSQEFWGGFIAKIQDKINA